MIGCLGPRRRCRVQKRCARRRHHARASVRQRRCHVGRCSLRRLGGAGRAGTRGRGGQEGWLRGRTDHDVGHARDRQGARLLAAVVVRMQQDLRLHRGTGCRPGGVASKREDSGRRGGSAGLLGISVGTLLSEALPHGVAGVGLCGVAGRRGSTTSALLLRRVSVGVRCVARLLGRVGVPRRVALRSGAVGAVALLSGDEALRLCSVALGRRRVGLAPRLHRRAALSAELRRCTAQTAVRRGARGGPGVWPLPLLAAVRLLVSRQELRSLPLVGRMRRLRAAASSELSVAALRHRDRTLQAESCRRRGAP
mmetsp:Transcript_25085/g.74858  ORF Transcript_25085/g.74858 Transcript_25085/m.74858 type:complete len:310 (+) Transcript_25085:556-1485(+)